MQTRLQSFVESCVNTAIGFVINVGAQVIVFPWFGINVHVSQNIGIAILFTVISIARSYVMRRAFNALHAPRLSAQPPKEVS